LRVLPFAEPPEPDDELAYEGKVVGRITSVASTVEGAVALAYVRREVPEGVELELRPAKAQLH
jgi:folate-binding Fe-S cluster repair protein YgfZ